MCCLSVGSLHLLPLCRFPSGAPIFPTNKNMYNRAPFGIKTIKKKFWNCWTGQKRLNSSWAVYFNAQKIPHKQHILDLSEWDNAVENQNVLEQNNIKMFYGNQNPHPMKAFSRRVMMTVSSVCGSHLPTCTPYNKRVCSWWDDRCSPEGPGSEHQLLLDILLCHMVLFME